MLSAARDALWAAGFIRDFAAGDRPTWFKRFGGVPRVSLHVASHTGRRDVEYRLYATATTSGAPRPALIVAHGFTHEGAADPRLVALCGRLARLGWIVVSPEFHGMRRYRLALDDSDDFETVVSSLADHPDIDPTRIGLMGFSFGAGPLLIALTRRGIRDRARFALIFGGYFDLRRTMKYVLTGAYDHGGLRGRVRHTGQNDDRWKFLGGNVHLLPPSATRSAYVGMVEARIGNPSCPVDLDHVSEPERALFELMGNRDPESFDRLYERAAPSIDEWVRVMSPCGYAAEITTPLVIVHSETDPKTHFTESLAMSRGLPHAPPPQVAIVNTFSHVDLRVGWRSIHRLRSEVLPGMGRLWRVGQRLVREQRVAAGGPSA